MEAMTSEREAFEKWADDQGFPLPRWMDSEDYQDLRTQTAWDAWNRRAHLAQPAQAVDVGAIYAYMDDKGDVVSAEMIEWYRANYGEDCSAVKRWTIPLTRRVRPAINHSRMWQPLAASPTPDKEG